VPDRSPPRPRHGPASYVPFVETKHDRSIADWQEIVADCGLEKHMAMVDFLKSDYGMGHGHASALVGWTRAGSSAAP